MAEVNMPNDNEPQVVGTVKKKRGLAKWKDVFIAVTKEEFESSFTNNLLYPACRELMIRLAHGAVDILFNGADNHGAYYRGSSDRTPYYLVSHNSSTSSRQAPVGKSAAGYSLDDIGFGSYDRAYSVLNVLNEEIKEYKVVDVYKFYAEAKKALGDEYGKDISPDYTDHAWGWEEPLTCKPLLRRDGMYFLPLPKPKRIAQR